MYYNASTAPFKRAILESGAATARAVFAASHPRHEVQFREFLVACGLGAVPEADIFPRLRKLPLETVVAASVSVWKKYEAAVCWPFQPASDPSDGIMPRKPVESWRQGFGMRGIPVLTGFNVNEGTVFIPPRADSNAQFRNFFSTLIPSLTSADLDELDAFYPDPVSHRDSSPFAKPPPPRGFGRQWRRLDAAYAHFAYICPVLQTAHFLSNSSSSSQPAPVYVYRYAATSGDWNTANHVDEAPIVTHDLDLLPDRARDMPGTRRLVRAMHGYWARFAATGDPNPPEGHPSTDPGDDADVAPLPVWPKFVSPFAADESRKSNAGGSDSLGQVMVFGEGNDERWAVTRNRRGNEGTTAQAKPLAEEDLKQCEFWWKRVDLSEGLGRQEGGARL